MNFGSTITVTIKGRANPSGAYVEIEGTKYSSATTLEVQAGTVVTCYVMAYMNYPMYINSEKVNQKSAYYKYTILRDCEIAFVLRQVNDTIIITES